MNATAGSPATPTALTEREVRALAWAVRRAGKTSAAFKSELASAERAIARLRTLPQADKCPARDRQELPAADECSAFGRRPGLTPNPCNATAQQQHFN